MGMAATQSHAMRLEGAPAVRLAWDGPLEPITRAAGPLIASLFTAVVLGVARRGGRRWRAASWRGKADQLRAYEQVEWSRAEQDHWLAVQAYEGGAARRSRAATPSSPSTAPCGPRRPSPTSPRQTLLRLTRVLGGGTFSRRSPFAHWFEDVRALGFLRPPWGLAYDNLFATSFGPPEDLA